MNKISESILFYERKVNNDNRFDQYFKSNQYKHRDLHNDLEGMISKEEEFDVVKWMEVLNQNVICFLYEIVNIELKTLFCEKINKVKISESIEYYFFDNFKFGKKIYFEKIKARINDVPQNTFNTKIIYYFNNEKVDKNNPLVELLRILESLRPKRFLENNSLKDEDIRQIFIKRLFISCLLKEEKKLELSGAYIQEVNTYFLFDSLACNSNIRELIFKENSFGLIGMSYLASAISLNNSFTLLDLSRNQLNHNHLNNLRIGLSNITITNLKYLSLADNALKGTDGGKAIGQILEYLPNLQHLNLNKNELEKGGVYLFLTLLKLMKLNQCSLKRLIISKTNLEDCSLQLLGEVIKHPYSKLELLSLNDNNLNNYGGVSLIKKLQFTNTIRELYLYNCSLNDNHFDLIRQLIINNKIDWISIHNNKIFNPKEFLELLGLSQIIKEKANQDTYQEQMFQYFDISYNKLTDFNENDFNILLSIIHNTGLERLDFLHSIDFSDGRFYEEFIKFKNNKKVIVYF